jgi:stalled ribosome rescue protein Dom34
MVRSLEKFLFKLRDIIEEGDELEEKYTKVRARRFRKALDELCKMKVQVKKDMIEFEKTLKRK